MQAINKKLIKMKTVTWSFHLCNQFHLS